MPLFKKKAGSWIMPIWNSVCAYPDLLDYLEDCIEHERTTHPNDKWNNTPEERIVGVATMQRYYNAYLQDRILEKLPNEQAKSEYFQIEKEVKLHRKTEKDIQEFLRRTIPNVEVYMGRVMQDFYNLMGEDANNIGYDINMDTGEVLRTRK